MVFFFQNKLNIYVWLGISIFGILFLALNAQAFTPPQVYFGDISLSKHSFQPNETIQGKVKLKNYDNFIASDLILYLELLSQPSKEVNFSVIDEQRIDNVFTVLPGEEVVKEFNYIIPSRLPIGIFKLRVILGNSRGEEIGWTDKDITVAGKDDFLVLNNCWIIKNKDNLFPGAGAYYQKGENPKISFSINNKSVSKVVAYPKITTYARNSQGEIVKEERKSNIVIGGLERENIKTEIIYLDSMGPGVYLSEVKLLETGTDEPISNATYFRWIISGDNIRVLFAGIDKNSYKHNERVAVRLNLAASKGFLNNKNTSVFIRIFDGDKELITTFKQYIYSLNKTLILMVPLSKTGVDNPLVEASILNSKNKDIVFDKYIFQVGESQHKQIQKISFFKKFYGIFIFILFLIIIIAIIMKIKSKKQRNLFLFFLVFLFSVLFFPFGNSGIKRACAAIEVAGDPAGTNIIINKPYPYQVFTPGDRVIFEGAIKTTYEGASLFFNKIDFFISSDNDLPITIAENQSDNYCCKKCLGSFSRLYECKDIQFLNLCDKVEVIDGNRAKERGYNAYKLGTINVSDDDLSVKPYWIQFKHSFIIPEEATGLGLIRFYVQFSGVYLDSSWHWNIAYQPGIINMPPKAKIVCDPSECRSDGCNTYTKCNFCLKNKSYDIDGIDDIVKTKWDIYDWGTDCDYSCSGVCDYDINTSKLSPGPYIAELYVEDKFGHFDIRTTKFVVKKEIQAGFMCSLDNKNWQICPDLLVSSGNTVYFKDSLSLLLHSSQSEGAKSIIFRSWSINNKVFDSNNNKNPCLNLTEEANTIKLTVIDDKGRIVSKAYTIRIEVPKE
ncbi:MAG: hypothetical protein U9P88_02035 [Patescibacteria group bacterium]|nr:hypothetical protein [Patescibacteria group bacterium]